MEHLSNTMTPNALAEKLAGSANRDKIGKTVVRPLLRRYFPRDASQRGSSWFMTDTQIAFVTAAYNARKSGKAFDADAFLKARKARKAKAPKTPATPVTPNDAS